MKLTKKETSLSENITKTAISLIENCPELLAMDQENLITELGIIEVATKIESTRKFKIKEYENVYNYFMAEKVKLYENIDLKGGSIDRQQKATLDVGIKITEKAKELRRERNRQTSRFDTNILSHAPFFAGGSKKRKAEAAKEGSILIDKTGLRQMSYRNDKGVLLTCNDAKTLAGLFSIWEEQGWEDKVRFTTYQLVEKLNMGIGGKQYDIVAESLEKLGKTSVVLQEAYIRSEERTTITERFPLIIGEITKKVTDASGRVRSHENIIEFSPYIKKSFKDGYFTLISLAVFDELETEAAKAIYLMVSGMQGMDKKEEYIKPNGVLEIPLTTVYETLFLENSKSKNKMAVERACEELKHIDVISNYYFVAEGKKLKALAIEPSEWLKGVLSNDKFKLGDSSSNEFKLSEPIKNLS